MRKGWRKSLGVVLGVMVLLSTGVVLLCYSVEGRHRLTPSGGERMPSVLQGAPAGKDAEAGREVVEGAPRRIAGVVVRQGLAVTGATVRLLCSGARPDEKDPAVVSDARGGFSFEKVPAAPCWVIAEATGSAPARVAVDLRDPLGRPAPETLTLSLRPCDVRVFGFVRDGGGGPVRGAAVLVAGMRGTTDESGSYDLCVERGLHGIKTIAEGYAPGFTSIYADGRTRIDFVLRPATTLSGTVIEAKTGRPVAGARVYAQARSPYWTSGVAEPVFTVTDGAGRFHFRGLAPGRYGLSAYTELLGSDAKIEVRAVLGVEDVIRLTLSPRRVVSGRVVLLDGTPAAGAIVTARGISSSEAVAQLDGRFQLPCVADGEYVLGVKRFDLLAPVRFEVGPSMQELHVTVRARATVRGRVVRDGHPVVGARVFARRRHEEDAEPIQEMSLSDGSFEIRGLAEGEHEIGAESQVEGAFAAPQLIALRAGERREGIELDLSLAGQVQGLVEDEEGRPVPWAFIRLSLRDGKDWGESTTQEDGSFTVRALAGGGRYDVEVRPNPESPLVYRSVGGGTPNVEVPDGHSRVNGLRVAIRHQDLSIEGVLLSTNGEPVPDINVQAFVLSDQTASGELAATATTDGVGAFTLRGLLSGTYRIRAEVGASEVVEKGVAAGRMGLVLTVQDTGRIRGRLVGFKRSPEIVIISGGLILRPKVQGNAFLSEPLAPGSYSVSANTDSEWEVTSTTVVAHKEVEITLESHGQAVVNGRVLDLRTRKPVEGVVCSWSPLGRNAGEPSDAAGAFHLQIPAGRSVDIICNSAENGSALVTQHPRLELVPNSSRLVDVLVLPEE